MDTAAWNTRRTSDAWCLQLRGMHRAQSNVVAQLALRRLRYRYRPSRKEYTKRPSIAGRLGALNRRAARNLSRPAIEGFLRPLDELSQSQRQKENSFFTALNPQRHRFLPRLGRSLCSLQVRQALHRLAVHRQDHVTGLNTRGLRRPGDMLDHE